MTLIYEIHALKEKEDDIKKELEEKESQLKEEHDRIQRAWESKVDKIVASCDGTVIEEWYDTDGMGHNIMEDLRAEGFSYPSYSLDIDFDEAIKHTEELKQEYISEYDSHIVFLEDLKEKLIKLMRKKK